MTLPLMMSLLYLHQRLTSWVFLPPPQTAGRFNSAWPPLSIVAPIKSIGRIFAELRAAKEASKFGVFEFSVPSPASYFVGILSPAANRRPIQFSSASSFDSRTDQVIWTNIRGAVSCQRGQ